MAASINPGDEVAKIISQGVALHQAGQFALAEKLYRRALLIDPNHPDALHLLGLLAEQQGRPGDARPYIERAISLRPNEPLYQVNLGLLCARHGWFEPAERYLRQTILLQPNMAEAHGGLAMVLGGLGRLDEAEASFRKAIELTPATAELHCNFGQLLLTRGKTEAAIEEFSRAIGMQPSLAPAHYQMGVALRSLKKLKEAAEGFSAAVKFDANFLAAWQALAEVRLDLREAEPAIEAYQRAIALQPTALNLLNLGMSLSSADRIDESITALHQAAAMEPTWSEPRKAIGSAYSWCGRHEEAVAEFEAALKIDPGNHAAASARLYTLLFGGKLSPEEILAEHKAWGGVYTGNIERFAAPANDRSPTRRLKVGYVSPNFRNQAVSNFVLPILENHDPWEIEIFCYSDARHPDLRTERFRRAAHEWREITGLSDEQLASQIRRDGIDILVELTGHIGGGRLRALAYKPAPIQVSYIGYQATTGVAAVDYFLTDGWADPVEGPGRTDGFFVEKLYRLPAAFFCYEAPVKAMAPGPLPMSSARMVTFGCMNNLAKVTERTIELWARVLNAVPNSRFIMLIPGSNEVRQRMGGAFAANGIAADRIEMALRQPIEGYLETYNRIDIALDPVPFNGHTTTCDAAWMGCPTVSLAGNMYAYRYGGCVMRNVGLEELVADTQAAYVEAAVKLAGDRQRLEEIRLTLRDRMKASIITDGKRFTSQLEAAYREMWGRYVGSLKAEDRG